MIDAADERRVLRASRAGMLRPVNGTPALPSKRAKSRDRIGSDTCALQEIGLGVAEETKSEPAHAALDSVIVRELVVHHRAVAAHARDRVRESLAEPRRDRIGVLECRRVECESRSPVGEQLPAGELDVLVDSAEPSARRIERECGDPDSRVQHRAGRRCRRMRDR